MFSIHISIFILLQFLSLASFNNDLNCDFLTTCCWREPTPNPFINDILASDIIDLNWYRRTFKVGKSKPPPAKNYLLRSVGVNTTATSIYESCAFCSENGIVNIEFRHWQSPSTKFYICFKELNKPIEKENCELVNFILQSKLVDVEFEVEKREKMTLVFMVSNPSHTSEATVMIDHINVRTAYCGLNIKSLPKVGKQENKVIDESNASYYPPVPKASVPSILTEVSPAIDEKVIKSLKKTTTLGGDKKFLVEPKNITPTERISSNSTKILKENHNNFFNVPKTTPQQIKTPEKKVSSITTTSRPVFTFPTMPSALSPPVGGLFSFLPNSLQPMTPEFTGFNIKPSKIQKPKVDVSHMRSENTLNGKKNTNTQAVQLTKKSGDNPFVEMFGKEFADFLDPSFETSTDEDKMMSEQNMSQNKINNGKEQVAPTSTLGIFDPQNQVCNTVGGCLFDRSFCSYHNVPDLANGGEFRAAFVGKSRFIEARLNPGQVAVFQSKTNMLEDHVVMFDVLEWVEGEKLSGCCIVPGRQPSEMICPYETSIFQGPIEWKGGQMACPKGTTVIMFICENYGKNKGVCGIDNIRLHKTTDIPRTEPCQKNLLMKM
uniref:MAM domain-containing protein n=1 Tax=Strongyloides venezuelensis TaxID=75913 RepID=A0A0K0F448_STRVS